MGILYLARSPTFCESSHNDGNVEWSDTGVFEQRCKQLGLDLVSFSSFSRCCGVFCVARDIN